MPINQASAILPQLRDTGRVSRGYIGVTLRDVDPDLQRSLGLKSADGALVQDVTPASPGARAGIRTYDLIVAVDGARGRRQRRSSFSSSPRASPARPRRCRSCATAAR